MTIEEAIYCLKTYDPESDYSACFKCPYYGSTKVNDNIYICQSNTARKIAIEALKKESRRRQKMYIVKDMSKSYISDNIKELMGQLIHVNEITDNEEIKDMCLKAARYISNVEAYRYEIFCHTEAIKQQLDRIIE